MKKHANPRGYRWLEVDEELKAIDFVTARPGDYSVVQYIGTRWAGARVPVKGQYRFLRQLYNSAPALVILPDPWRPDESLLS